MSDQQQEELLVATLSDHMLDKLRQNSFKPYWRTAEEVKDLVILSLGEMEELVDAMEQGQAPWQIWREAADVANLVAMAADTYTHRWEKSND